MGKKGFTLIELLVTITIIGVLASAVIPLSMMSAKRTKEMELRQNLRAIRKAIDDYKTAFDEGRIRKSIGDSGYPPSLTTLVEGVDDVTSPKSRKIRFLRRVPPDPVNNDVHLKPEEAWGLRSYESGPDDPREGDDVFDVYSRSQDKAIDGTYYRNW